MRGLGTSGIMKQEQGESTYTNSIGAAAKGVVGMPRKVGVIPLYEDDQLDIVEGTDEEGNKILLQVMEYFFYNGEEYVVLGAAEENDEEEACEECECEACGHEDGHEHETDLYIMKVLTSTDENGEEVEEFVPVEEDLMDKLIQVVQTNFSEEDDDDDSDDSDDSEDSEEEEEE